MAKFLFSLAELECYKRTELKMYSVSSIEMDYSGHCYFIYKAAGLLRFSTANLLGITYWPEYR